jgi:hypothetical protein
MATQDLWGDLSLEENIRTPVTILREQAALLGQKTNNILEGEVSVERAAPKPHEQFLASFFIVAPLLNKYRYQLLSVQYPLVKMYPLVIFDYNSEDSPEKIACEDEASFVQALGRIFIQPEVKKVLSSLISQSRAEN